MAASTPEGRIKRKLSKMLRDKGVWYFYPASNGFGRAGIPDLIAIVDGQFVGLECKADPTKKPTALQKKCGEDIEKAGGTWFLVNSDDMIQNVQEFIENRVHN